MGSKKFNLNKILSAIVGATSFLLVSIFIAICLLNPVGIIKAEALTKEMITGAVENGGYNIHFTTAKTKVKNAHSYIKNSSLADDNITKLKDVNGVGLNTYQYSYNNSTPTYYTTKSSIINSAQYGTVELISGDPTSNNYVDTLTEYDAVTQLGESAIREKLFIPEKATHFTNANGNLSEVLYGEINDGDFAMLDNYNVSDALLDNSTSTYADIENFYIAFGTPENDYEQSTPLALLEVEAYFYNEDGRYIINTPNELSPISHNGKDFYYYNQYFDLRNLEVKNAHDAPVYNLKNCEGKYEFIFRFTRYDKDLKPVDKAEEEFKYTFYLLDSANYTVYPTFSNADRKINEYGSVNEYFYSFGSEFPTLSYNPERINLSYHRENNEVVRNLTSSFSTTNYLNNANSTYYPMGIINYYMKDNNSSSTDASFYKRVYILTYYDDDMTSIQYLYLSDMNNINAESVSNGTYGYSYDRFMELVKTDTLNFEYKTKVDLTSTYVTTSKYTNYQELINGSLTLSWDKVGTVAKSSPYNFTTNDLNTQYNLMNRLSWEDDNALEIEYSYDFVLKELGNYTFDYLYVCPTGSGGDSGTFISEHHVNANKNLTPTKYYEKLKVVCTAETHDTTCQDKIHSNTQTPKTENLTIRISGYFSTSGKLNLLDKEYNYDKKTLTMSDGVTTKTIPLDASNKGNVDDYKIGSMTTAVEATHQIKEDASGIRLIITITGGTHKINTTDTVIPTNNGKEFTNTNTITSYTGSSILSEFDNIGNSNGKVNSLYTLLHDYKAITNNYTFETNTTNSVIYGQEKLHIFGSMAYFSKKNATTDSGYSKMELKNSKYQQNYYADITKLLSTSNTLNEKPDVTTKIIPTIESEATFNKENIILTDMQVMWKNFSSLSYGGTDNKVSNSYIYRYNYKFNGNQIVVSNLVSTERFTKDTYCQNDGLYIIIVEYNYFNFTDASEIFYQVFTFIIDNSAPNIKIELQNENGDFEPISYNKYTNKNVKISWEIPSYFKNNVYLNVNKSIYSQGDIAFEANFDGEKSAYDALTNSFTPIIVNTTTDKVITYTNAIANFGKDTTGKRYEVIFKLPSSNPNKYNLDGTYSLRLYYGNENIDNSTTPPTVTKPYINETFIIDTKPIDGQKILPIMEGLDDHGQKTYVISDYAEIMKDNQQIINRDFTFRYNPKASQASIYTYWYKIPLTSYSQYQQIVNVDNSIGITTNLAVAGDSSENESKSKQYIYDYNLNSLAVNEDNRFIGNGSAIYLFEMYDDAGNTCRYVVFYDGSTPMTIVTPKPENSNNIVSDVTQVTWGDYKAIKIKTDNPDSLVIDADIDTYNTPKNLTNIKNIDIVLSYINSYSTNNNFNNTMVKKVGNEYYILVPITKAQVQDEQKYINTITGNKDFYFFPVSPYDNDNAPTTVELPTFNAGQIQSKNPYTLVTNNTTPVLNNYGEVACTYLNATYKFDSTTTNKLNGVYGQGVYIYTAFDGLGNKSSGNLWVNLDKTQTMIYGTFNYDDTISDAQGLTGSAATSYSLAKMYISSLENIGTNQSIPSYTLTYQYFPLNTNFYKNNTIVDAELKIEGTNTYLYITIADNSTLNNPEPTTRTIKYIYKDSEDQFYPARTYPYDLEGETIIKDSSNNPKHIYSESLSSYETENNGKTKRVYSSLTNATTNVNNGSLVTQEGFYIIKREYASSVTKDQLGLDSRIIYRSYYVDRSGIINVMSSANASSALFNIGEDIQFELGKLNTQVEQYAKLISAENIQNNIRLNDTTLSNTNAKSTELFKTNKVEIEFTLTTDKFNYDDKFYKKYDLSGNGTLKNNLDALKKTIFNSAEMLKIFKLDLNFYIDELTPIINENENTFNDALMQKYLHDYTTNNVNNFGQRVRDNYLTMFYGTSNPYNIKLTDQSGYFKADDPATTINEEDTNCQANILSIDFNINHQSPYGDAYGKYYGTHDYDESSSTSSSIPLLGSDNNSNINGNYQLISRYLKGSETGQKGQLKLLSETQDASYSATGTNIKLVSTNNETLVFLFSVTNDEYMAQIDVNNIKITQEIYNANGTSNKRTIFNRVQGVQQATSVVSAERQSQSFIRNTIDGVDYYAIIIFDNNLDDILDADEKLLGYSNFRLLDAVDNPDKAKYYIEIQYIGDADNYKQETTMGTYNYSKSTYTATIDRIKPMYNLSRLMYLDKFFYNPEKSVDINSEKFTQEYDKIFANWYKNYYGERLDKNTEYDVEFIRSDLEKYFFALDTRQISLDGTDDNTEGAFKFKSIDSMDSSKSIYIRNIANPANYKFSFTPDDYEAYNSALYRGAHPQFVPENSTVFSSGDEWKGEPIKEAQGYYEINYENGEIDLSQLIAKNVLQLGDYYEIIEHDEAGNYRVYGIYLANSENTTLAFEYKTHANGPTKTGTLSYTNSTAAVSGMNLQISEKGTKLFDKFLKAILKINSNKLNVINYITYDPIKCELKITDGNNKEIELIKNITNEDSIKVFINKINTRLEHYHLQINNPGLYYSEYGYNVDIDIVDRLGIPASYDKTVLTNFEIDYAVAGSILKPEFKGSEMFIPALTGSTYVTSINVYKFNKTWNIINEDSAGQLFNKQPSEFRIGNMYHDAYKKYGTAYYLNKGVYKVVVTDNFNRTNTHFWEYGISSTQTGGSLKFAGPHEELSGYLYSSNQIQYVYDSSVYDVYIRYTGRELSSNEMVIDKDVFSSNSYNKDKLKEYGITAITTSGSTTTIVFAGVSYLNKYHIKTILASTSTDYKWGDEQNNNNIFVYNHKIAIYTGLPNIAIKNMKGNILDSSNNNLNLTEDFELVTSWSNSGVASEERLNFNARISLTRKYNQNGVTNTETMVVNSGYIVTKAGDYEAKVINNLGNTSEIVKFTRGEGTINMYAIYAVNKQSGTETKLSPSTNISTIEDGGVSKTAFHYYVTNDFMNYYDLTTGLNYDKTNLIDNLPADSEIPLSTIFAVNKNANKYVDIRVNSTLSIFADIYSITTPNEDLDNFTITYKIYSHQKNGGEQDYVYRYICIHFVKPEDTTLLKETVIINQTSGEKVTMITNEFHSVDNAGVKVTFKGSHYDNAEDAIDDIFLFNTIYIDRFYNNKLVETKILSITDSLEFTLPTVGLHSFKVRDLAGRIHEFVATSTNNHLTNTLYVYLVNQILFNVNDSTPINNQIFNETVKIDIISQLGSLPDDLYDNKRLGITVLKNGTEISVANNDGHLTFSEPGHYSIQILAITDFANTREQISTNYSFEIIRTDIAKNSYSISKGYNFLIDKVVKYSGKNIIDMTYEFTKSPDGNLTNTNNYIASLIWLSHNKHGNSTFEITLKSYDSNTNTYQPFTFKVWINNELPSLLSNVDIATRTTDTITIDYNPALIYSQVGTCKLEINGTNYVNINSESQNIVNTITISKAGEYVVKIISDDGSIISTYKYIKADPMNGTTKLVLICVAIGAVVLVVLFFMIRKKGKYR